MKAKTALFLTLTLASLVALLFISLAWAARGQMDARAEVIRLRGQAEVTDYTARAELRQQIEQEARPAAVLGRQIAYLGFGLAGALLALGAALAGVGWLNLRATTVYPNAAGQMPLLKVGGAGWHGYLDPNRSAGPLTVFRASTLLERAGEELARLRAFPLPAPLVSMPLPTSEAAAVQIAAQASAVAMTAAATRGAEGAPAASLPPRSQPALPWPGMLTRPMPEVEQVEPSHVERLLEISGER